MSLPHLAAAIVLAGGKSRRMGQDKALLQLKGEALLTRTCRMALAVSDRALVITACAAYSSLLPQGCELLLEAEPKGPLVALAQGLQHIEGSDDGWVLLLACDLPLLTVADLAGAIAHLAQLPPEVDAYLPPAVSDAQFAKASATKQIDWEPLCGFYRQRCLPSLIETIHQGTRSFQRWLMQCHVEPLTQWPAAHLLNCNCPEDWARVREIRGEVRDR